MDGLLQGIDFSAAFAAFANGGAAALGLAAVVAIGWLALHGVLGRVRHAPTRNALTRIDGWIALAARAPLGLTLRKPLPRRAAFAAAWIALLAVALLAPVPAALAASGSALFFSVGLMRVRGRMRAAAAEAGDRGAALIDRVDLRVETLAGVFLGVWVAMVGASRLASGDVADSATGMLSPVLFLWAEAARAAPMGDAATALGWVGASESAGWTGVLARGLVEALLLVGLVHAVMRTRAAATGRDQSDVDALLATGDEAAVDKALELLEARALKNRRSAQMRLARIAAGARADGRFRDAETRLRAAGALLKVAEAFNDAGAAYSAADGFRGAVEAMARKTGSLSWAHAHVGLGDAIVACARITGRNARASDAIEAYVTAERVLSYDDAPDEWAGLQDKKGAALMLLAADDPTARGLREAVAAFREGLQLRKRGGLASDRARTQEQLAHALLQLGQRSRDQSPVREAIAICRDAEEVHSRAGDVADHARIRALTAEALHLLSRLTGDASRLRDADSAICEALGMTSRKRDPVEWARLQDARGRILKTLAARTGDSVHLEAAIAAFNHALEVRTPETMAADWTETRRQMGDALRVLGGGRRDAALLERAVGCYTDALGGRDEAEPESRAAMLHNLGVTLSMLGRIREKSELMDRAAETLAAAVDLIDPDVAPTRYAATQHALGVALQEAGHMLRDRERLKAALAAFAEALSLRGRETEPGAHAATRRKIGETYVRLFPMTQDPDALDHALENFEVAREAFTAVGDKARAGEMTEHIRRVRAVHRSPPREVATPSFGRAAAG